MNAPRIKEYKQTPERMIQNSILEYLRNLGWFCLETHGNMYQSGLPDLYTTHSRYGARWVEVKNAESYSFTPAQMDTFPKLTANGTGIWILCAATKTEYDKLWGPPNWYLYLMGLNHHSANLDRINRVYTKETAPAEVKKWDGKSPLRSI